MKRDRANFGEPYRLQLLHNIDIIGFSRYEINKDNDLHYQCLCMSILIETNFSLKLIWFFSILVVKGRPSIIY